MNYRYAIVDAQNQVTGIRSFAKEVAAEVSDGYRWLPVVREEPPQIDPYRQKLVPSATVEVNRVVERQTAQLLTAAERIVSVGRIADQYIAAVTGGNDERMNALMTGVLLIDQHGPNSDDPNVQQLRGLAHWVAQVRGYAQQLVAQIEAGGDPDLLQGWPPDPSPAEARTLLEILGLG